jgi:hypothetical protein
LPENCKLAADLVTTISYFDYTTAVLTPTQVLHVAVKNVSSGGADLRILGGQVGDDGSHGERDDLVQRVTQHGHHLLHHLERVQVHLGVGVLQARQELVKDLQTVHAKSKCNNKAAAKFVSDTICNNRPYFKQRNFYTDVYFI